jgi:hypothetical protein
MVLFHGANLVTDPRKPRRVTPRTDIRSSPSGREALRDIARQLAQDVLHQFGIPDLLFLRG